MVTLVAVHGNGGGGERFAALTDHLAAAGVELVAPTLPGFGGRPLGTIDDLDGLAAALVAELAATRRPRVLLGHGIGGAVALQALAQDRDVADALILHAPVGTRLDTRWFPRLMRPRWVRRTVQRTLAARRLRPVLRRLLLRDVPHEVADRFLAAYGQAEAFAAMFDWLTPAWFRTLPTLPDLPGVILWGEDDRVLDARQQTDYRRLLPRAAEVTIPGWGHFPMLAQPRPYATVLAALTARLAAAADGDDAGRASFPTVVPLGQGSAARRGMGPKAALLDHAAAAGLDVPPGLMLLDVAEPDLPALSTLVGACRSDTRLAVRSAFPVEDGQRASFAGVFRSHLDVPADAPGSLHEAMADVLASADDVAAQVGRRDLLLVDMVPARHAGVAFTERDHEDDLVEHVAGLADGMVSGQAAGHRTALPKLQTGERARSGWQGRLQRLLRAVRRTFGTGDWDIEWADDGHRCWLLQVRPITAPVVRDEALTLANHREILPDLPSTFMTSLVVDAAPELFGYWRRFDPDLPADRPFVTEVAGRPVINLSLLTDTMRILGLPTRFVTDSMGGTSDRQAGPSPARLVRKAPRLVALGLDQLRAVGNGRRTAARLHRLVREPGDDLATVTATLRRVHIELITGMFALTTAISGPLAVLDRLGIAGVLHARQRTAGTRVLTDLLPLKALVDGDPDLAATLRRGELPLEDPRFAAGWRRYLERHGHRGIYESDIARPRYHEDPAPLIDLLRHARTPAAPPPLPLRARLVWPLWWQASRAMSAREDLRSDAMRAFDRLRARLRELAADAVTAGRLPHADDLWLLTVDEVARVARGEVIDEATVEATRRERDRLAQLRLPDLVRRSDDPATYRPHELTGGDQPRLRGLGLTYGTVTGRVWQADEPGPVPDTLGDPPWVLVTRGVDAGWISTFARVDAVVVETGGELSHGSIVLRETGMPAVTNVADATRQLATGDLVRVDAATGVVEVLMSGPGWQDGGR